MSELMIENSILQERELINNIKMLIKELQSQEERIKGKLFFNNTNLNMLEEQILKKKLYELENREDNLLYLIDIHLNRLETLNNNMYRICSFV